MKVTLGDRELAYTLQGEDRKSKHDFFCKAGSASRTDETFTEGWMRGWTQVAGKGEGGRFA
jgi:hypothetical protein